eukprot:359727_1
MAHFKNNLQTLGNEFEKANRKLAFSTNTFQSELSNMNKNNIQSTIYPHNTSSRSLSPIVSNKIENNNNNLLQTNASFPLPSNPKSTTEKHQQISSIGTAIDKRLQNLRAKLRQLEQEDKKTQKNERNNCIQSTNKPINKIKYISKTDTALSLPLINNDTLDTSFAQKYKQYMQKYHGNTSTYSYPEYNTIATQNLVSKIKQKSKALFETDIDYKNNMKNNIQKQHKNIAPYITDDNEYDKTIKNFDDELNKTWNRTQLRLKKIKSMNEHFKKRNNYNNKISVTQSITSSHWTIDSTHYENINNTQIPTVYENKMTNAEINNSGDDKSFFTADSYHVHGSKMDNVHNTVVENVESKQTEMDKYVTSINENEKGQKVINLSFNKGIQVRIPVLCSHCNRDINTKDIAVISLENKKTFVSENMNIKCMDKNEQKIESNEYDNIKDINMGKCDVNTTMSESDRKQLIMDLKSIDGDGYNYNYGNSDCKSDGILFEDKYKNKKSLRAKVNDMKLNMNQKKSCERKCDDNMTNAKHEEYLYLKRKLLIYENKLRNIDPTLLE